MTKELAIKEEKYDLIADVEGMQNAAKKLMQTPHYAKLGNDGIFAIVQKARSLNVNELDALNGALYYLNGKVGMSAEMMCMLIRTNGHSITKDPKSNDNVCILHGRRKDNGDTWTESFSIDDAKRAGIYKNTWEKYPRNMCYCRALSNLARQLFPDVIKGCYEIEELKSFNENPTPINYNKSALEKLKEIEANNPIVELTEEQKEEFYQNFNGDVEWSKKYVAHCMKAKKVSESVVISNLQTDLEKSQKTYESWKKKQLDTKTSKPLPDELSGVSTHTGINLMSPISAPSMEPVSMFGEEK